MLVVKIGGGAAIGEGGYTNFAEDLATIAEPVVVVHGGNAEFSELSRQLGMPPRMITSSSGRVTRYTDAATMDAMLMAYCGKVNKRLVATLRAAGINAVGLSAIDGGIATGRRKPVLRGVEDGKTKVLRDDHAGTLEQIDPSLVRMLLEHGGSHPPAARAHWRGPRSRGVGSHAAACRAGVQVPDQRVHGGHRRGAQRCPLHRRL